jgi:hypothetical protein
MPEPDAVLNAARSFLDALLPVLKEKFDDNVDTPLTLPWVKWVRDEAMRPFGSFRAVHPEFSAEEQCAARMLGELREAGFAPLLDLDRALAADEAIGPRLDHEVLSSGGGGQTWQADALERDLADRTIRTAGGFDLHAEVRDVVTAAWLKDLRRPSDTIRAVIALSEFDAPVLPIDLAPNLQIAELSDDEVGAALALGAGIQSGLHPDERTASRVIGIRSSCESKLFIGGVPPEQADDEMAVRNSARERAERVVLALRLFKAGRVREAGSFEFVVRYDDEVSPSTGSANSLFGWHPGEPYVLEKDELVGLCDLWSDLEQAHTRSEVEPALRRFRFAAERSRPDDEIVDLMIASESLFLHEIGTRDRGELRFRISTRAAALLGATLDERLRLSKFMRGAYDVRSAIAHGGTPGDDVLRDLEGERATIPAVADDLEDVLRRALQAALRALARRQRFPPEAWEKLTFALPGDAQ